METGEAKQVSKETRFNTQQEYVSFNLNVLYPEDKK